MENTIENNKLIAEFMGIIPHVDKDNPKNYEAYVQIPNSTCPNGYHVEEAKYHSSWDWLMPVVEKIARIPFEEDYATACARTFGMLNDEGKIMVRLNRFQLHIADTLIEATYAAVLEYINWYNSNQPPTINQ